MTWWASIGLLERGFWIIALAFSPLFLFQLIQTLLGFADLGFDGEDAAGDDGDDGGDFHLFTLRNIVIFFTVFGWAGIAFIHADWQAWRVVAGAFALALGVMLLVARLFVLTSRLSESGNLDIENAVGLTARVYLTIPEQNTGAGKVHILLQGGLRELPAASSGAAIATGAMVRVMDVQDDLLIVEPCQKEANHA